MENFLNKLASILEVESVKMDDILTDFEEWDSLTTLSILATIDTDFGINISAEELLNARTVQGLVDLIKIKKGK